MPYYPFGCYKECCVIFSATVAQSLLRHIDAVNRATIGRVVHYPVGANDHVILDLLRDSHM